MGVIRTHNDPAMPSRALTLRDLEMKVRYRDGDTIETDCNCDSTYMLKAMDRAGESIRAAYHWIPRTETCYLVMDKVSIGLDKLVKQSRFWYSLVCRFDPYVGPSGLYVDPFSTRSAVLQSSKATHNSI